MLSSFFFFNDTATTEIYTLSLHDALPISETRSSRPTSRLDALTHQCSAWWCIRSTNGSTPWCLRAQDRKSTRLNSSHSQISYAVFCLKKKNKTNTFVYVRFGD